jgi:lysozyme
MTLATPRPINAAGIAIIKRFEGFSPTAYLCPAGVKSIGWGHTHEVNLNDVCTKEQAERYLWDDLRIAEAAVLRHVRVPLSSNQYSALVSFVFNFGEKKFSLSTMLALLNKGWYQQVPAQLIRWIHSDGKVERGLINRRNAESALWNTPDDYQSA